MEAAASRDLMDLALRLARRGLGRTAPNPLVGAVIVKDGRVVGRGYHRRAGGPHAEVVALRAAGCRARGGTLFVTLEPCDHFGRTPPCTEALIRAGIRSVMIAARDPNPITNGRGLARLRRAGIHVTCGLLEREARQLNRPFEKHMTQRLPWVVAKIAQSLDGKIATSTGESRWITSPAARRFGQRLRRDADAVLVGITTVLRDDPRLTVRFGRGRPGRPLRVIVDSHLRTPPNARLLLVRPGSRVRWASTQPAAPILIATTTRASQAKRRSLEQRGAEVWVLPPGSEGRVPLRELCRRLAERGVQSLLIEGGGEVLAGAFAERLIDRVVWCISPQLIGGRDAPGSVGGRGIRRLDQAVRLRDVAVRRLGPDLIVEARVAYPRVCGGVDARGTGLRRTARQDFCTPARAPSRTRT